MAGYCIRFLFMHVYTHFIHMSTTAHVDSPAAIRLMHADSLTEGRQGKRYLRFLQIKNATADLSFDCKVSKKERNL